MTPSLFELLPRPRTLLTLGALCALALVLSSPALRTLPFNSVGALVGSKEVTFTYGGLVRNETNLSTGVSHQWLDLGDAVIDLTSNAHYFKHYDGRGNVKFLTDEAGDVVTIYNYHAYGLEEVLGDSALDPNSFAGGFRTGNTNNDPLIMGARVYDPAVGRFLSEDPLYNPLNQYAYTNGNPVNFSDPSGMYAGSGPGGLGCHCSVGGINIVYIDSNGREAIYNVPTSNIQSTPSIPIATVAGNYSGGVESVGGGGDTARGVGNREVLKGKGEAKQGIFGKVQAEVNKVIDKVQNNPNNPYAPGYESTPPGLPPDTSPSGKGALGPGAVPGNPPGVTVNGSF